LKYIAKPAIILMLVLLVGVFAGCGRKTEKADTGVAKPAAGGKISVGSAVEPETWNPLISEQMAVQEIGRLLFSGLLLQNDKGEWLPDLAVAVPTA
jgi:peptide/nickel transport system substrate-binding protein